MKKWFVRTVLNFLWWLDSETCEVVGTEKAMEFFNTVDPADVIDVPENCP